MIVQEFSGLGMVLSVQFSVIRGIFVDERKKEINSFMERNLEEIEKITQNLKIFQKIKIKIFGEKR